MTAAAMPTVHGMAVTAPAGPGVAPLQDALCALRLAVWTLERSTVRDDIDNGRIIDMIVRRAEQLRVLLADPDRVRLDVVP
jgi:hypothetical protein